MSQRGHKCLTSPSTWHTSLTVYMDAFRLTVKQIYCIPVLLSKTLVFNVILWMSTPCCQSLEEFIHVTWTCHCSCLLLTWPGKIQVTSPFPKKKHKKCKYIEYRSSYSSKLRNTLDQKMIWNERQRRNYEEMKNHLCTRLYQINVTKSSALESEVSDILTYYLTL